MKDFKLNINLLPKGAWNNDLSKTLAQKDWDKLRRFCYERAKGKCEICGANTEGLDAHEVWEFDKINKTQTLKNIIAICTKCHGVIHFKNTTRLGYAQSAKQHFMTVNNATELDFANHLTNAIFNYEELNKIYRWKIIANLKDFGGDGIIIKQNNTPLIKNPYKDVDWANISYIDKKELFEISKNGNAIGAPQVVYIVVDNYQGKIQVQSLFTDKIEWYLDDKKIKTKYNVIGLFTTNFSVKELIGKKLRYKLTGVGGQTVSKSFEFLPVEVA